MNTDRLEEIFQMRESFMDSLRKASVDPSLPNWPVDLGEKSSQQYVRDMALRGVEEMFEALQHLKNWKPHRQTEVKDFNREEFLEEIVDAFNYFLSILVLTGFDANDFIEAYRRKDKIKNERLETGY